MEARAERTVAGGSGGSRGGSLHASSRRRRATPIVVIAAVAFLVGVLVGAGHGSRSATGTARDFVSAWVHGDYARMYSQIDGQTQLATSVTKFADAYRSADELATVTSRMATGRPHGGSGGAVVVPVRLRTRLFGTIDTAYTLRVLGSGGGARIAWTPSLAFPGLLAGERLTRHTTLPPRASLLARDGSLLASGPPPAGAGLRSTPLGSAALALVGEMGPIPPARRGELLARGVPPGAIVGTSGLELALDAQLTGHPGGELLAGSRVLASTASRPASAVHTTISPALQRTAVAALGGQLGGIVAMRPNGGEIMAVAGLGINDLQPPGSTFKMITLTGVLESGLAKPTSSFPVQTFATLDGVKLQNANGESCGGTLANAFAVSCNSVFAPLGAKLGARRLVATAERFGFNQPTGLPGAIESRMPAPSSLTGDLSVGSAAIGQDAVDASPLQMALVAATIADGGRRPRPTFLPGRHQLGVRVTPSVVAHTVRRLMQLVVQQGTGVKAAIPGVSVAGKTGTAELTNTVSCSSGQGSNGASSSSSGGCQSQSDPRNTDAWFAAFAPALRPRIVVCVLMVRDGAGGDTAAPVARQVLQAGLSIK